jgi:hypothetical protein
MFSALNKGNSQRQVLPFLLVCHDSEWDRVRQRKTRCSYELRGFLGFLMLFETKKWCDDRNLKMSDNTRGYWFSI